MRPAFLQRQGAAMRCTAAMTEGTDVITTTLGELIEVAREVSETEAEFVVLVVSLLTRTLPVAEAA